MKKFHFNKQLKYLLTEMFLIFCFCSFALFFLINEIQSKTDRFYADFALKLTKTIALIISDSKNDDIQSFLKDLTDKNENIAYIEYLNTENKVIYSTKNETSIENWKNFLSVNYPVTINNHLDGMLIVGIKENGFINSLKIIYKYLTCLFILLFLFFISVLLFNMSFISKEFKKIYKGVREITSGKFGYTIESEDPEELADAFNEMSHLLSKYDEQNIEQITLERNKLEAVLMSIINGVIVCDNYDRVVLTNSAALKMLDIDETSFLNTKIQDFVDSHAQKCFQDKIEEFKETPLNIIEQKPIEFNIEAGKLTIKAMISPMFSKQQEYVGYIIVLIDITRETEVNKLKNTFISNVSHELRTPVTILRTYIDTLCNNGDDFDDLTKKEFMHTIDIEAKRLHTMVNDILDFSRLESNNINLRKEYSDLSILVEQNIKSMQILADEKNIKIKFTKEQDLPKIPINIESIDRAIRNLLSNAIKYSLTGKDIQVNEKLSDDKQYIELSVKDRGIGIAKEHLDKIFDRFYRVENATHTIKGTGLGLHLVKITVEKHHNGKITLTSKVNEGSTFTIYLPLTADESELV